MPSPKSNLDDVQVTDRGSAGNQPDGTPSTGTGATGGGGGGVPPTGPAGGDLAGAYPNPSLAAIGAAAGPIGDATHVAAVTIDTKGRVTGLTSVAITPSAVPASQELLGNAAGVIIGESGVFNVQAYGASPTASASVNWLAFDSAIADMNTWLTAKLTASLYAPAGIYSINAVLRTIVLLAAGTASVRGDGRGASIIRQTAAAGIFVFTPGNAFSNVDIHDIGLQAAAACTKAIAINYGSSASAEQPDGCSIHDVAFLVDAGASGTWSYGLYANGGWKYMVRGINGAMGTSSTVIPTLNTATGANSLLCFVGGTNIIVSDVYCFSAGAMLMFLPNSVGQSQQGIMVSQCIAVNVNFGVYLAPGSTSFTSNNTPSAYYFTNILIDQGNAAPPAASAGIFCDCTAGGINPPGTSQAPNRGQVTITHCFSTQNSITSFGFYLKNVSQATITDCTYYAGSTFLKLENTSITTYISAIVSNNHLNGGAISLVSSGGATVPSYNGGTNAGGNNQT